MWIWGDGGDTAQPATLGAVLELQDWTKRATRSGGHLPDQLCIPIFTRLKVLIHAIVMITVVSVNKPPI